MIDYLVEYEVLGYIAIIFNLLAFLQKSNKNTLILILIASIIFIFNMILLKLPLVSIYIVTIGLFITIISLIFINQKRIRHFLIKTSPIAMLYVIYLYGFNFVGIMSGLGFFLATVAKLQSDILPMKYYLLASTITWLILMTYLAHHSFIVFYAQGVIVLLYSIQKERKLVLSY